jgi:PIN domain nuclease of toxin-antitoxin system
MSVLLDTNGLIWLLEDNSRLGQQAIRRIDDALRNARVMVSATTFWEVAMLLSKNRIKLSRPPDHWRADVLRLGIEEIPVDGEIALESVALSGLPADPADRFIVATALKKRAQLVTSDARLLGWNGPLTCIDARV